MASYRAIRKSVIIPLGRVAASDAIVRPLYPLSCGNDAACKPTRQQSPFSSWACWHWAWAVAMKRCRCGPVWARRRRKLPGVDSPSDRIKSLRELAKKAPETTDPGQRKSICRDLAQQIRKEPDSILRGEILRTLAAYGGETATAVLHAAVKDTDADVRKIVCDLWGRRPDAEAAKVLADMLASDSDKDVRMAAAGALGQVARTDRGAGIGRRCWTIKIRPCSIAAMVSLQTSTGKDLGTDVDRWRQYVKTGEVRDDRSLAQNLRWYR